MASWVLGRAQADGVKRLYFLSRDAQLLGKAARILAPQFGGIECRYLYVSRQALFLPSADSICPEEMPWISRAFEKPRLDMILAKLELCYEDIEPSFGSIAGSAKGAYILRSEAAWADFWGALNRQPLKTRILDTIAKRRTSALHYFRREGLFDAGPWALVDLGWFLTCQASLWKLLKRAGWMHEIRGYYLGLQRHRKPRSMAGLAEAIFNEGLPELPLGSASVFSRATLLEHVVGQADHHTVHHYEGSSADDLRAVFQGEPGARTIETCLALHDEVLEFVEKNRDVSLHLRDGNLCNALLSPLLDSFTTRPDKEAVMPLRGLVAATDQNNLNPTLIAEAISIRDVMQLLLPRRFRPRHWRRNATLWPEGSTAITSPAINTIYLMALRADALRARVLP